MIKTLNIINKTYCSKCSGQRITPLHLEDNHNIILPRYDFEKELRNLINLKKGTKESKRVFELHQEKYSRIYENLNMYN